MHVKQCCNYDESSRARPWEGAEIKYRPHPEKSLPALELPKRVLSKYHASLTSIAATRGKRAAQPSSIIVLDNDEDRMADDYAEDEHDDDEEEEEIEEPEDEDDKDFIVPDEDMEEEEEGEEKGEEEDAPGLVVIDGEEDEEDYEPTPAGEAGTSGGYRPKK